MENSHLYYRGQLIYPTDKKKNFSSFYESLFEKFGSYSQLKKGGREAVGLEMTLWIYSFYLFGEKADIPTFIGEKTYQMILNEYRGDVKLLKNLDKLLVICKIATIVRHKNLFEFFTKKRLAVHPISHFFKNVIHDYCYLFSHNGISIELENSIYHSFINFDQQKKSIDEILSLLLTMGFVEVDNSVIEILHLLGVKVNDKISRFDAISKIIVDSENEIDRYGENLRSSMRKLTNDEIRELFSRSEDIHRVIIGKKKQQIFEAVEGKEILGETIVI